MNEKELEKIRKPTTNSFIGDSLQVYLCDVGQYVTNRHWVLNLEYSPNSFRRKINSILKIKGTSSIIPFNKKYQEMQKRQFKEVFLVEEREEAFICESEDKSLKVGFNPKYFSWLVNNIPDIRFLASSSEEPCKLIKKGMMEIEIGFLMPYRI